MTAGETFATGTLGHLQSQATPGTGGEADGLQFYSDDFSLINELSRFIGAALGGSDSGIIIATQSHRDQLASLLARRGLDLSSAAEDGRYICLDAAGTLTKIMVDGWP